MTYPSYEREKSQEAPVDLASLREADVVLIGEAHTSRAHQREQARLITELRPEYVLHEGWDDATPDETRRIINSYAVATLQDLIERGFSLQQWGITSGVIKKIEKKKGEMCEQYRELYQKKGLTPAGASQEARELVERDGLYPSTFTELLETPFYEWGTPVCDAMQELLLEEQETEGDKYRGVREKVAKRIRKQKSYHDRWQGMDYLYRALAKTGGKLVGCDIKKSLPRLEDVIAETRKTEDILTTVREGMANGYRDEYDFYRERLVAYIQKIEPLRERTMGARIVKYAKQRTEKKPILAIVGSDHLKTKSKIYPILEIAGVRWKTFIQEHENSPADDVEYVLQLGLM